MFQVVDRALLIGAYALLAIAAITFIGAIGDLVGTIITRAIGG